MSLPSSAISFYRAGLAAMCIAACLLVSACGFSPLYGNQPGGGARSPLAGISIDPIDGRSGQILTKELENRFDPLPSPNQPVTYGLKIALGMEKTPVVVEPDGTISRYNIMMLSTYRLYDKSTGVDINTGSLRRITSFNDSRADFSTFVSEQDAVERGLIELAEDYRMRIAGIMAGKRP